MTRPNQKLATAMPTGLVVVAGMVLWLLQLTSTLSDAVVFFFLTLLLLAYLCVVVQHIRFYYPKNWLLHPLVLCSLMTFVMGFGATNTLFFFSNEVLAPLSLDGEISAAMVKHMELVLLGAIALVMGYNSSLAINMSRTSLAMRFQAKCLPGEEIRSMSLPVLTAISIMAGLVSIRLGVMGYNSDYEQQIEAASYTMYLGLLANLGELALVMVALSFYSPQSSRKIWFWLIAILLVQVLLGFISGMKSGVAMPFVILLLCQYIQTGKFSHKTLMLILASIIAAYSVIEPFRIARNSDATFDNTSIESIINTLIAPDTSTQQYAYTEESPNFLLTVSSRYNLTQIGSYGLVYADENPDLPLGSPAFLENIFMAPLHALVPRFIWTSKPIADLGLWYNQVVIGNSHFSSTAMGPFTYLYFAGGSIAVFIGFYFIGIVQRTFFMLLQPGRSMPSSVIYLVSLTSIATIDSSFNSIIIFLCRELPMSLLFMFILFKGKPVTHAIK
jgi:hypothetical protein